MSDCNVLGRASYGPIAAWLVGLKCKGGGVSAISIGEESSIEQGAESLLGDDMSVIGLRNVSKKRIQPHCLLAFDPSGRLCQIISQGHRQDT